LRDGFLGVTVPGRELREVLPEQIDRIVRGFSFTKSMRWDETGIRFARPVRWVLAKLDAQTIVGETSYGHRLLTARSGFPPRRRTPMRCAPPTSSRSPTSAGA
jgi:glycyl-tRNA synthetase beta subunit